MYVYRVLPSKCSPRRPPLSYSRLKCSGGEYTCTLRSVLPVFTTLCIAPEGTTTALRPLHYAWPSIDTNLRLLQNGRTGRRRHEPPFRSPLRPEAHKYRADCISPCRTLRKLVLSTASFSMSVRNLLLHLAVGHACIDGASHTSNLRRQRSLTAWGAPRYNINF